MFQLNNLRHTDDDDDDVTDAASYRSYDPTVSYGGGDVQQINIFLITVTVRMNQQEQEFHF